MANTRQVKISIDPTKVVGGPHAIPVLLPPRSGWPTEVFDPSSGVHGTAGNLRALNSSSVAIPIEVVTFILDTSTGSGDGFIEAWVPVAALVSTDPDPHVFIQYGDGALSQPAVTDPLGRNAVWSNYHGVWHGDDLADSAGNYADLTNVNAATVGATGKIGDAVTFNGSTQYLWLTNTETIVEPFTLTAWAKSSTITANQTITSIGHNGTFGYWRLTLAGATAGDPVHAQKQDDSSTTNDTVNSTTGYAINTWYKVTAAFASSTSRTIYLDAGSSATGTTSVTNPTADRVAIGVLLRSGTTQFLNGSADEIRVAKFAHSANFEITEYNNQNSPATFASVGTPISTGGATISESLALGIAAGVLPSASVLFAEALAIGLGAGTGIGGAAAIADSLTLSQAMSITPGAALQLSQSLGLGITAGLEANVIGHYASALTIGVAAGLTASPGAQVIAETIALAIAHGVGAAPALTINDALDLTMAFTFVSVEGVTFRADLTLAALFGATPLEALTFNDLLQIGIQAGLAAATAAAATPPSPDRTIAVAAQTRSIAVEAQGRTITVLAQVRSLKA